MRRAAALFLVGCLVFIPACLQAEERIKADRIVVLKNDHKMLLYANGQVIRTYKVALGRGGLEKRERAGDHRVPEGTYVIDWRNPNSRYHLSLHISYPNPADRERAKRLGVDPGGDIMIHGLPNGRGWIGCLPRLGGVNQRGGAGTESANEENWEMGPDGTP